MPIRTPKRLTMALVAASLRVGTTGCVTAADQMMMMMSREQGRAVLHHVSESLGDDGTSLIPVPA